MQNILDTVSAKFSPEFYKDKIFKLLSSFSFHKFKVENLNVTDFRSKLINHVREITG